MLIKPSLESLLPKVESRYTLAMLVAKRARQLVDGAQPMVDSDTPNLVTLACEEVYADKVLCVSGLHKPVVPLRPEIEEQRRQAREAEANAASLDAFSELMDPGLALRDMEAEPGLLFRDLSDPESDDMDVNEPLEDEASDIMDMIEDDSSLTEE
jgi:DNA-directed RNA polymerase subunit omega